MKRQNRNTSVEQVSSKQVATCLVCHMPFTFWASTYSRSKSTCSRICAMIFATRNGTAKKKNCVSCLKVFMGSSLMNNCSDRCVKNSRRRQVPKQCEQCLALFEKSSCQVGFFDDSGASDVFCSDKCREKSLLVSNDDTLSSYSHFLKVIKLERHYAGQRLNLRKKEVPCLS